MRVKCNTLLHKKLITAQIHLALCLNEEEEEEGHAHNDAWMMMRRKEDEGNVDDEQ